MNTYDDLHHEVDSLETVEGITALSATMMPQPFGPLLRKLIRQGSMTLEEIAAELGLDPQDAQHLGSHLAAKGYLREEDQEDSGKVYRVYLARIRKQSIPLDF
jgi:hypothetical protein